MSYIPDRYLDSSYIAEGYLFNSEALAYVGDGGITIGGAAERTAYGFNGGGGISCAGDAETVLEFHFDASGGITLSSTAETYYMPEGSIPDWYMPLRYLPCPSHDLVTAQHRTMEGGVTMGGAADGGVTGVSYEASGGIAVGGAAYIPGNYIGVGGVTLGGAGGVGIGVVASGGVVLGGEAGIGEATNYRFGYFPLYYLAPSYIPRYYFADVTTSHTGAGGVTMGGAAEYTHTGETGFVSSYFPDGYFNERYIAHNYLPAEATAWVFVGASGIVLGGEAVYEIDSGVLTGSGGVTLGGTAGELLWFATEGAGGLVLGGTVEEVDEYAFTAAGGITTGGEAPYYVSVQEFEGSGGILTGGAAEYGVEGVGEFLYNARGGASSGGAVEVSWQVLYTADGGLTAAGVSEAIWGHTWEGSGGILTGGSADLYVVSVGGIQMGGSAILSLRYLADGTGGITMGGIAPAGIGLAAELLSGSFQQEIVLAGGVQWVVDYTGTIKR